MCNSLFQIVTCFPLELAGTSGKKKQEKGKSLGWNYWAQIWRLILPKPQKCTMLLAFLIFFRPKKRFGNFFNGSTPLCCPNFVWVDLGEEGGSQPLAGKKGEDTAGPRRGVQPNGSTSSHPLAMGQNKTNLLTPRKLYQICKKKI